MQILIHIIHPSQSAIHFSVTRGALIKLGIHYTRMRPRARERSGSQAQAGGGEQRKQITARKSFVYTIIYYIYMYM